MPIPSNPPFLPSPIGTGADVVEIPATTPSGSGLLSFLSGWPLLTGIPPKAGGIAPGREFFNAVNLLLSQHTFFQQSGNIYPWQGKEGDAQPGLNYLKGAHVLGSDSEEYVALYPSGPDVPASGGGFVGPVDPVGDESGIWVSIKSLYAAGIATVEDVGLVKPDGVTITIKPDGTISAASKYDLCEFYYFRHPTLKPGFQPAQGGLLANAATLYPEAWAYLQTSEGQKLCTTEAEWQAMATAIWHTNADGTTVGWNGIGGAPFYVQDLSAGTLRMPDLRGMYVEAAGFDSLGVGGVHGDGLPDITGDFCSADEGDSGQERASDSGVSGAFFMRLGNGTYTPPLSIFSDRYRIALSSGRVVAVAAKVQTRAWGALACVFLGQEMS